MAVKTIKVLFKVALYFLPLVPAFLWALDFSMPKDVTEEELANVPREKAEYGDSKQQQQLEKGGAVEETSEKPATATAEFADKEKPLEVDKTGEVGDAEIAESDEDPGFMEFPLEEPEAQEKLEEEPGIEVAEMSAEGQGRITGQVFDKETGAPVRGVAVAVNGTEIGTITDEEGNFQLKEVPEGTYTLEYFKTGYLAANITDVVVVSGEIKTLDFALPPRPAEMSDDVYDLGTITVTAEEANAGLDALIELRATSVGQVDFLSAEDFDKFGGSNIADMVNRMAGVNVVGGQFAVVRGLGDRYNSTLLNNLPVPSPDPIRQGVQLDLFPTSIIEGVVADKAFLPSLPSNSSGAAFNLQTRSYPEELSVWAEVGFSVNENAKDTLLLNKNARPPLGTPGAKGFRLDSVLGINEDDLSDDFKAASVDSVGNNFFDFGGQSFQFGFGDSFENPSSTLFSRIGLVTSLSYTSSSDSTAEGRQLNQFANESIPSRLIRIPGRPFPIRVPGTAGSFIEGNLPISGLEYDLTISSVEETTGFLFGSGIDFDKDGLHKLDFTFLRSQAIISEAVRRENGLLPDDVPSQPGFDRGFGSTGSNQLNLLADVIGRTDSADLFIVGQDILTLEERVLNTRQIAGSHLFELSGREIDFSWGLTSSDASSTIGNPDPDNFVGGQSTLLYLQNASGETILAGSGGQLTEEILAEDLAPEGFIFGNAVSLAEGFSENVIRSTARTIRDDQAGGRADVSIDRFEGYRLNMGIFISDTERSVDQIDRLINLPGIVSNDGDLETFAGEVISVSENNTTDIVSFAEINQEIEDHYFQFDLDGVEDLEISFGGRYAKIDLVAIGEGRLFPAIPLFGPNGFLGSVIANSNSITNGSLIGFEDPETEGIAEEYFLPAASLKYSFWDSWTIRLSYGETIALPSFRELSPIFTLETSTGDRIFGNPNLQVSEVQNLGARLERTFSDYVTSFAISVFRKDIENPIEQIGLVDVGTGTPVTSFFNNPNDATVEGLELEGRLGMSLVSDKFDEWFSFNLGPLRYFSVGGNVAFIDAFVGFPDEVAQTYINENASTGGSTISPFSNENGVAEFPEERRLFDQPEYTVNFDLTFEQPDWGTRLTLALFAQSDVLTIVGSGSNSTADQYTLPYEELDLTFSQKFGEGWEFEFQVGNITDSKRGLEYDSELVEAPERTSFRVGRTYSVSLKSSF